MYGNIDTFITFSALQSSENLGIFKRLIYSCVSLVLISLWIFIALISSSTPSSHSTLSLLNCLLLCGLLLNPFFANVSLSILITYPRYYSLLFLTSATKSALKYRLDDSSYLLTLQTQLSIKGTYNIFKIFFYHIFSIISSLSVGIKTSHHR